MAPRIPQAPEAEAAVLGAVLLRNAAFDEEGVADVQPDDFHIAKHAKVWAAIRTLLHGGHAVDAVTVGEQVRANGDLALVGGLEGVLGLADHYAVTHNVSEHARLVVRAARARRAQRILSERAQELGDLDLEDLEDYLSETHGELAKVEESGRSGSLSTYESAQRAFQQAKDRYEGKLKPSATGIAALDHQLDGGMLPGEFVVVAARPAMGKSVLALNMYKAATLRGEHPLMFALEMSPEQMGRRLITSRSADFPGREVGMRDAKLPKSERAWLEMQHALDSLKPLGGEIEYDRVHLDKLIQIARAWRRRCRQPHQEPGSAPEPGPILLDYLQLIDAFGHDRKLNRAEFIGRLTREVQQLAKELEVPAVILCQLNRELEKRDNKRPRLSDLRESGTIEQDANTVMFLYRPAVYEPKADPMAAEVIIPKAREGVPGTVHVRFEGHFSRFIDTSNDAANQPGWEYSR